MPCPLGNCLSIFRNGTMPEFSVCCSDQWWTTLLVLANLEYASATVWFLRGCLCYLRNSWVVSLTDSSQSSARPAKILCSDSEITSINMGICFECLAIVAYRSLSFACPSRIPHMPLATMLLVIRFQATSVSLGELTSWTFVLSLEPSCPTFGCSSPATLPGGTSGGGMLRNQWRG
jgi:hypothetical protein